MKSIASQLIAAKNLLGDTGAWLTLVELTLDTTLRLVKNTADITWNGQTWTRFPMEIGVIGETSDGEIPQIVIMVDNRSKALQAEVEAINGGVGGEVNIYLVHSENLAQTSVPSWTTEVVKASLDDEWAVFFLGTRSPHNTNWPPDIIRKTVCRHKYDSTLCDHTGSTCDKTLTRCRVLNNSENFGGFPGVGSGVIFL